MGCIIFKVYVIDMCNSIVLKLTLECLPLPLLIYTNLLRSRERHFEMISIIFSQPIDAFVSPLT
jgi:hypothetical protein